MENFKRSFKRLITRLAILGLVVICGAIAIAQANKDRIAAHAADPNLAQPGVTFNDAGNAASRVVSSTANAAGNALNALPDLPGWGESENDQQPVERQPAADSYAAEPYIEDSNFAPVQAVQEVADRFDSSFPARPDPNVRNAVGNAAGRLGQAVSNAGTRFKDAVSSNVNAGTAGAAELFSGNQVPAPSVKQPSLPTVDTALPGLDANFAQPAPVNNNRETPADVQPPSFDRFGGGTANARQNAPQGNPMRGGYNAAQSSRAPAAQIDPVVSSPTPPQNFDRGGYDSRAFESDRQQPVASYGGSSNLNQPNVRQNLNQNSLSRNLGGGKPGPREQEGPQNAAISIHKVAPTNVRVGQAATFQIKIRNNSQVTAENLLIRDEVPEGTQLVDTNPQATEDSNGGILWKIGSLRPNEDVTVSMQVMPEREGDIGSVASVTYQTLASARAQVKKPMLKITHSTKERVLVGDMVRFAITIENPGSGTAKNVIIEEDVPRGLAHSKGPKLEYEVGDIPAGGSRRLELSLKAATPGMVENIILARGANGLTSEDRLTLQVIAPQLQVGIKGPMKRYLERKATYTVAIGNAGTADAKNVEIVTQLPPGLKFVSTNNSGRYDANTNTVRWSLAQLPAGEGGEVEFTVSPLKKGDFNIAASATADKGLSDSKDHPLSVEGLAALMFEVKDNIDPIEVGGETTYQISVTNQGTEVANNVQFVALVPPGMRAVDARGPTNYQIQGNKVVFDSINRLPAKGNSTYNIRVVGDQANDHRFTVRMTSDNMSTPVVEEESTRVYSDQ